MLEKEFLKEVKTLYGIDKIIKAKKMSGGRINAVYDIKTEKGNFILKVLNPKEINLRRLKKEFELMNILKERNFPYKINVPLFNNKQKQLSSFGKKKFYIYKKIEGKMIDKYHIQIKHIKELAKFAATYHKFVKNIKMDVKKESLNDVVKEYRKIDKNELDEKQQKLLGDLEFFKKLFRVAKRKYSFNNLLVTHGDMSPKNIIFKKDKVVGIIDFEVIEIAPRISDLKYLVKDISYVNNKFDRQRYELFIREYNRINKLSEGEIERLPFMILLDECEAYPWVINHLENKEDFEYCKNIAKRTKTMIQAFHDKFKSSEIIKLI